MDKSGKDHHDSSRFLNIRLTAALAIVLVLTGATVQRNAVWQTLLSLWQDCAVKSPDKSRTHNNLGNCYMLLGRHFEAVREYKRAIELDPGNLEAYYNIAINLDSVGLGERAVAYYEYFCRYGHKGYTEARKDACGRAGELKGKASSPGLP